MLGLIDRIRYPRGHYTRRTKLAPVTADAIASVEAVAEAAEDIHARYGIKTKADDCRAVIVAANHRNALAEKFKEQDFEVLDTADVLEYKERSKKPTLWERFKTGAETIHWKFVDLFRSHWISALIAVLVTIPMGISALVEVFSGHSESYTIGYITAAVIIFIISLLVIPMVTGSNEFDEDVDFFSGVNYYLLVLPLQAIVTIFAAWLARPESGREWRLLDVKSFIGDKVVPDDIMLAMHSAHKILPDAKLQIEAMHEHGEATGEAFLALDVDGVEADKVYLWYSPGKS